MHNAYISVFVYLRYMMRYDENRNNQLGSGRELIKATKSEVASSVSFQMRVNV